MANAMSKKAVIHIILVFTAESSQIHSVDARYETPGRRCFGVRGRVQSDIGRRVVQRLFFFDDYGFQYRAMASLANSTYRRPRS